MRSVFTVYKDLWVVVLVFGCLSVLLLTCCMSGWVVMLLGVLIVFRCS